MNRAELVKEIFAKKSFLCVGLDTDVNKIPPCLKEEDDMIFSFNKAIIDATAPYCVAYKPNLAFYECYGLDGMAAFEKTIDYLHKFYPNHLIIADAKRGDIGNTSTMYAKTFFDEYGVDALTVAPYMGEDSVTPFLEYKDKWVIVLALTSNKGSHDFQLTEDKDGERLFEKVIRKTQQWGSTDNMMYVVGATQGSMFEDIRKPGPQSFPVGTRCRRTRRQSARGLQIRNNQGLRITGQLFQRHHLRRSRRALRRRSRRGRQKVAGADGRAVGKALGRICTPSFPFEFIEREYQNWRSPEV